MKVKECCRQCLQGLVEKTITLSGGGERLLGSSLEFLDDLFMENATPPAIANLLLGHIRKGSGVHDPFATAKYLEFREAMDTIEKIRDRSTRSLEGLFHLSALGNSKDHFVHVSQAGDRFFFSGDMDKIREEIYTKGKEVLFLGDNTGDFVYDIPLIRHLEKRGKRVFYAVKEHPVQNDLSMEDVCRFNLTGMHRDIICTPGAKVGLAREDISGEIERLWKSDAPVIAKGMGNYETMSEFDRERPVTYIMKIKCPAVSEEIGLDVGSYTVHSRW